MDYEKLKSVILVFGFGIVIIMKMNVMLEKLQIDWKHPRNFQIKSGASLFSNLTSANLTKPSL